MAVTTQARRYIRYTPVEYDHRQQKTGDIHASLVPPLLKASLVGGLSLTMLMLINLIPVSNQGAGISLTLVTLIGFCVICLTTGLLAALLAHEFIEGTQRGGAVAWMAGFWAGVFAAIVAMFMAANGLLLVDFGQSIVALRTPAQLTLLSSIILPDTLALIGRVLGAVLLYGLIGSLLSGLVSAFGGLVCTKIISSS